MEATGLRTTTSSHAAARTSGDTTVRDGDYRLAMLSCTDLPQATPSACVLAKSGST